MAAYDDSNEYGSIIMQPFNIPCTPLSTTKNNITPTRSWPNDQIHSESTPILTPNQRSNSLKHPGCCDTLWRWTLSYWKRQLDHVPIFYFTICLLLTPIVALVGFMEGGFTFDVTGIVTLTMCAYATYKFKMYIALKSAVTTFRRNNREMRVQLKLLKNQITRIKTQKEVLQDSAVSLEEVNAKNEQNLEKFQDIQQRMRMTGTRNRTSMSILLQRTVALNKEWTDMWFIKQRDMFQTLYDSFEQTRSESPGRECRGLRREFYQKFKHSLPRWHRARFLEQSQLDQLFETESIVCFETFCNALDLFGMLNMDRFTVCTCSLYLCDLQQ